MRASMFLRAAALAGALVACAAPAWATTYWVSPTGTAGATGADSTTNAKSLAWVNANAGPGDIVRFKSGVYTDEINPAKTNMNASRLRFYGFPQDPSAVVVPKVEFTSVCNGRGRYCTARWITSASSLEVNDCAAGEYPVADSIVACRALAGGLTLQGNGCVADSLTLTHVITSGDNHDINLGGLVVWDGSGFECSDYFWGGSGGCSNNVVKNLTLNETLNGAGQVHTVLFAAGVNNLLQGCTFNVTITGAGTSGYWFGLEQYRQYGLQVTGCTWNIAVNATIGGSTGVWSERDSSRYARFVGNTVNVTGSGDVASFMLTNSGTCSGTTGWSMYDGNVIRDDIPDGTAGVMHWYNGARFDTLQNNVIRTNSTRPIVFIPNLQDCNGVVLRHNTFYTAGSTAISLNGSSVGNSPRIVSGVYYSTGSTSAGNELIKVSSGIRVDSAGVYFARGGSAATAIAYNGVDGTPGSGGNFGIAGKSVWGSPRFVDSTYAALNATPGPGSYAQGGLLHDGYAGALTTSSDTCLAAARPGTARNFGVSATSASTITLTWTESGSDQFSGDDGQTQWFLKSSASPITTDAQWLAATLVANAQIDVPGNTVNYTDTGLGVGVTRYYSVRYQDGDGTFSCMPASAGATTVDNVAPSTVANLAVTATTASTASLSWTSPGDDGASGTATSYALRYRAGSAIVSEADWAASTAAGGLPAPAVAGTTQTATVTGLTSDRTYYFAIRATDDAGNVGAISNSPSGRTPDVTAPAAVSTLAAPSATASTVGLRWTAPGDDGSAGTAAQYDIRYVIGSAITNDAAFAAATPVLNIPIPQVAGTVQSVTVTGLAGGTAYAFAMKTADEAGNWSALSNSVSRTTVSTDVTAPAAIFDLAATQGTRGVLNLGWTAPGDDGSSGTATEYEVRFSMLPLGASTWDDTTRGGTGVQGRTYFARYPVADVPAPAVAGTHQTMAVPLRPGVTWYFAMRTRDEVGNWSAMSNVSSAAATNGADSTGFPRLYLYSAANPAGGYPEWYPYLSFDGRSLNTAVLDRVARFPIVVIAPGAGAADSFPSAVRYLRGRNPAIRILHGSVPDAAYYATTGSAYSYRLGLWNMLTALTPWPSSFALPYSSTYGIPQGYGATPDTTTASALLWSRVPGRKNALWGTLVLPCPCAPGSGTYANAGITLRDVNMAYRNAAGRYAVAEAMAAYEKATFYDRSYVERDGTTRHLWDGAGRDLHSYYADLANTFNGGASTDSVDWLRAGYSSLAAFQAGFTEGAIHFDRVCRQTMPDWSIFGANGGTGAGQDFASGTLLEGYPNQMGGYPETNLERAPGGAIWNAYRGASRPQYTTLASSPSTYTVSDTSMGVAFNPDTASARKEYRLGLGSAMLSGSFYVHGPGHFSIANGQTHAAGAYEAWRFDEQSFDTLTAQARSGALMTYTASLGNPLGAYYAHLPATASTLFSATFANGSAADSSIWFSLPKGAAGLAVVRPGGPAALTYHLDLTPAALYGVDWQLAAISKSFNVTGQDYTVTGWLRADTTRFVHVALRDSATGGTWGAAASSGRALLATPEWRPFAFRVFAGSAAKVGLMLTASDTLGTVSFAGLNVYPGDSTLYVREFEHGAVLVNFHQSASLSHTFGRLTRRLYARTGVWQNVNNGTMWRTVTVPASDAVVVTWPIDSLRPNTVSNLLATSGASNLARLTWTAPGNDSTTGTPSSIAIRMSTSAITTENEWNSASPVANVPAPLAGGTSQGMVVNGLAASTTYYFAMRAYDAAGYVSPISNSDSTRTTAAGAAPVAAFGVTAYTGNEPLAIEVKDHTTNGPTAWEWYLRRTNPAGESDPQISSDQNPTFTLHMGGTYTLSLQASNAFGSDTTLTTLVVYCTPPSPINTFTGSPAGVSSVSLVYKETGDDGDTGVAASVEIRYVEGAAFTIADWDFATPVTNVPMTVGPGTTQGVVVSGLAAEKTFAFAARAVDDGGCYGPIGKVVVVSTRPNTVQIVGVSAGAYSIKLKVRGR